MHKFVFVHIPKTAGMSLVYAFSHYLGKDACLRFGNGDTPEKKKLMSLTQKDLADVRFVSGHFWHGQFSKALGNDFRPISVFRDPVDRFISSYNYLKTHKNHPRSKDFALNSFENYYDFLLSSARHEINMQCKYICGAGSFTRALKNLTEQSFIYGVIDDMPGFQFILEKALGSRLEITKSNTSIVSKDSISRVSISPELINKIYIDNLEDYRLYTYARRRSMIMSNEDIF